MTSDSAKPDRTFALLSSSLTQLVDDRLDEEQYDQAVELLDQLCTQGVRPNHSQIRKLFALSLCSLAPEQMASTAPWTHEHQHGKLVARSLLQPVERGERALQSASRSSDRPSDTAVLQASNLLIKYSQSSSARGSVSNAQKTDVNAALSRHILECLPSQQLAQTRSDFKGASRTSLAKPDQEDAAGAIAMSKWIEERLLSSEDVWDLLAPGQFNSSSSFDLDTGLWHEFWMDERDQKRYQKQILSEASDHKQLEDRLADLQRRKPSANLGYDSSDADSDDSSSSDSPKSLVMPKRGKTAKTSAASKSRGQKKPAAKKRRTDRFTVAEEDQAKLKLTEGAWRTLSILLHLWQHTAEPEMVEQGQERSLLLWQFKRSHLSHHSSATARRAAPTTSESTDQIDRALDIALSFPRVLAPFKRATESSQSDLSGNIVDKSTNINPGSQRLISKVAQSELEHRQKAAARLEERRCIERSRTAADLLMQMYTLVKLKQIQHAAFVEGCAERLKHLTTNDIKHLCVPLSAREPLLVAKVLIRYLQDFTMRHPDDLRSSSKGDFEFSFEGEPLTVPSFFAVAVPSETEQLGTAPGEEDHSEVNAVRTFLQQNKVRLNSDFLAAYPLTFPSKKEYLADTDEFLHDPDSKVRTRQHGDNSNDAKLSARAKADKLKALAYTRYRQLQARNRVNELKFIVARCIGNLVNSTTADGLARPKATSQVPVSSEPFLGSSDSAASTTGSISAEGGQRKSVSRLLGQLVKAYDKDCKDFTACLLAMKTHIGVLDHQAEEESRLKDGEGLKHAGVKLLILPTLQLSTTRSQKLVRNTENLAHACRILREVVLSAQ